MIIRNLSSETMYPISPSCMSR